MKGMHNKDALWRAKFNAVNQIRKRKGASACIRAQMTDVGHLRTLWRLAPFKKNNKKKQNKKIADVRGGRRLIKRDRSRNCPVRPQWGWANCQANSINLQAPSSEKLSRPAPVGMGELLCKFELGRELFNLQVPSSEKLSRPAPPGMGQLPCKFKPARVPRPATPLAEAPNAWPAGSCAAGAGCGHQPGRPADGPRRGKAIPRVFFAAKGLGRPS